MSCSFMWHRVDLHGLASDMMCVIQENMKRFFFGRVNSAHA